MLIKTIVDNSLEGAVRFERCTRDTEKDVLITSELWIAPVDYDDDFIKTLTEEAAEWYVHTTSIYDYESSTDQGDGRDDYSKEENDKEITLDECIVKDGKFAGVICKAFDREDYILITDPKVWISHPRNYSGRGYHFYRNMFFELISK